MAIYVHIPFYECTTFPPSSHQVAPVGTLIVMHCQLITQLNRTHYCVLIKQHICSTGWPCAITKTESAWMAICSFSSFPVIEVVSTFPVLLVYRVPLRVTQAWWLQCCPPSQLLPYVHALHVACKCIHSRTHQFYMCGYQHYTCLGYACVCTRT